MVEEEVGGGRVDRFKERIVEERCTMDFKVGKYIKERNP